MKNFGRQIKLFIGNENESIEVSPLRIIFDVLKTITPEPNPSKISICNLNSANRELILSGDYDRVILSAGYEEIKTIFAGDIIKCEQHRKDLDTYIDMECGDGAIDFVQARMNTTLAGGASEEDLMKEAAKTLSLTGQGSIKLPVNRVLPRGRVLAGNTRDVLHRIAKNNQADWFIQDGELVMLPENEVLSEGEGFLISKDTGMIGSPERTDKGLRVTCFLNPALFIGGLIRVESIMKQLNGGYKVTELRHKGDYLSDQWHTEILCAGGTQ